MRDNVDSFSSKRGKLLPVRAGCNRLAYEKDGQKGDSMVCKFMRPADMWWAVYRKYVEACKRAAKRCNDGCKDRK